MQGQVADHDEHAVVRVFLMLGGDGPLLRRQAKEPVDKRRALAIEARDRYANMQELWADFMEALTQSETPSLRRFKSGLFRR